MTTVTHLSDFGHLTGTKTCNGHCCTLNQGKVAMLLKLVKTTTTVTSLCDCRVYPFLYLRPHFQAYEYENLLRFDSIVTPEIFGKEPVI